MITICYLSNRVNPRLHWFFDSLYAQWDGTPIKIVVVDFHYDSECRILPNSKIKFIERGVKVHHVAPKPTVWQGKHRLTKRDYFAASNTRNTGLCLAEDGYIVYVDDLSVLLPGWFQQVKEAAEGGWIACGAYAKVKELKVENGVVKSFLGLPNGFSKEPSIAEQVETACRSGFPGGLDSRITFATGSDVPHECGGSWMFGASCAIPLEALLKINGWDEDADSMGSEDYLCGIMLERAGLKFKYCKRMMTLESEEAHHEDPPFLRIIKGPPGKTDSSHRILNWVMGGNRTSAPNYFGEGGIRALRKKVLAGEPFPICQIPQHHWPDGQSLSEM